MKPRTVALRDQLVAVLRDAEVPMATALVAAHSGLPYFEVEWRMPCERACEGDLVQPWGYRVLTCSGIETPQGTMHTVAMPPSSTYVYAHLRALERAGLVVRVYLPGMRAVYWAYVHTESDAAMNSMLDSLGKEG